MVSNYIIFISGRVAIRSEDAKWTQNRLLKAFLNIIIITINCITLVYPFKIIENNKRKKCYFIYSYLGILCLSLFQYTQDNYSF